MDFLDKLANQQYLSIETFRKSGVSVKTPVWFVKEGNVLYVRTISDSGKVKRIHNDNNVNVAPCKMDGTVVGEWFPATAQEIKGEDAGQKVDQLLDKKYGLMKKMFSLAASLQGKRYTVLELKMRNE